jgi:eukaryotic-like serine/threonine-protein kinase
LLCTSGNSASRISTGTASSALCAKLGLELLGSRLPQSETIFNARYAPDGETVLYSSAADGNVPDLFIHRADYPAPQTMGLHDVHLLSISTKGEVAVLTHAVYVAHRLFKSTLAEVAVGGGAPREILQDVREADWSPDGTKLAIIREVDGKDRLEFPIGKVLFTTAGYVSDLRFSPQADRIAFFDHPFRWDDRGSVNVLDLEGHSSVLSDGYQSEEGLAWAPTGKAIYFAGQLGNGFNTMVYELTLSGQRRTVLAAPDDLSILDVSREGKLLVSRGEDQFRLMALVPGSKSEQDMSWLDDSYYGALSPDGRTLLFYRRLLQRRRQLRALPAKDGRLSRSAAGGWQCARAFAGRQVGLVDCSQFSNAADALSDRRWRDKDTGEQQYPDL